MPPLRAVGHLLPLRNPHRISEGKNPVRNLLDHHQAQHLHEAQVKPYVSSTLQYYFFGRSVDVGRITDVRPMRISDVAAIALEQTFGKADNLDDVFCVPWGVPDSRDPGRVFWDVTNDRTIAKAREGHILALEGTNVVEAAIYLPRIYESLKARLKSSPIPENIAMVEAAVEGKEEWSFSAVSALHIKCRVPNPYGPNTHRIDESVATTLENAFRNRIAG